MRKNNRKNGWLIVAALLAVMAVLLMIYVVVEVSRSSETNRLNEEFQHLAHGSSASSDETSVPETTTVASETTTAAPETTTAARETTTAAPETTTAAPETTTAVSETTTAAPETTTAAPETTTAAPETTTAAPETTTAVPETTTAKPDFKPVAPGEFPSEAYETIDFEALKKECADIYAWITVPGVDVDFPIVRHPSDNAYYLNHDLKGEENRAGSIFTESYNSKDFSDFITVVYGHSMRDGSMFAPLMEFRDRDFFDKHRYVVIHTEDKTLVYQIFAAYPWDDRHILLNYDYTSELMRYSYISYILGIRDMNSVIADDVDVETDDKILTLSCCTYVDGRRFIVQGVLVGET